MLQALSLWLNFKAFAGILPSPKTESYCKTSGGRLCTTMFTVPPVYVKDPLRSLDPSLGISSLEARGQGCEWKIYASKPWRKWSLNIPPAQWHRQGAFEQTSRGTMWLYSNFCIFYKFSWTETGTKKLRSNREIISKGLRAGKRIRWMREGVIECRKEDRNVRQGERGREKRERLGRVCKRQSLVSCRRY